MEFWCVWWMAGWPCFKSFPQSITPRDATEAIQEGLLPSLRRLVPDHSFDAARPGNDARLVPSGSANFSSRDVWDRCLFTSMVNKPARVKVADAPHRWGKGCSMSFVFKSSVRLSSESRKCHTEAPHLRRQFLLPLPSFPVLGEL